ncbi:protein RDM1-like [Solanum pennellii]|uniref:Protein RDM1-like n=1 Tax=Solanum pennellii TaxID=28526 RepID=A0ABM1HLP3_SOLPN|nr:protein RDM1-like [Solanum pennellii]
MVQLFFILFLLSMADQDLGVILRKAKMYQEYMQIVPIPARKASVIPFNSWIGLATSIKGLYGQPLHYLTNLSIKKWDSLRTGASDEEVPLDILIDPAKAEAGIWLIEEMHRKTTSPYFIARLWHADPMYHANICAILPDLKDPSK